MADCKSAAAQSPNKSKKIAKYQQYNIVSNVANQAKYTDPNFINSWGLLWLNNILYVANSATNIISRLNRRGTAAAVPILLPTNTPDGSVIGVTGLAANKLKTGFLVPPTNLPAQVLFVGNSGAIGAIDANGTVAVVIQGTGAHPNVYQSVAQLGNYLYATNFALSRVDVYSSTFVLVGSFTDAALTAAGYAPFGITVINKKELVVSYAKQNTTVPPSNALAGDGNGYLDLVCHPEVAATGQTPTIKRLANRGVLNAPYSLIPISHDRLLVGNHGDGTINVFDLKTKAALTPDGQPLLNCSGQPVNIDSLWGLTFTYKKQKKPKKCHKKKHSDCSSSSSASASSSSDSESDDCKKTQVPGETTLWFSAGPDGGAQGLVGKLVTCKSESDCKPKCELPPVC